MKKLIFLAAIVLIAGIINGQSLQRGNLIGTHTIGVTLAPGVTLEKFVDFYNTEVIPEMIKAYPGGEVYMVKGMRGQSPNSYGLIFIFKTQKDRDQYYNSDGTETELGKQASAKMKPVLEEISKMGKIETNYTDWLVL